MAGLLGAEVSPTDDVMKLLTFNPVIWNVYVSAIGIAWYTGF